MQTTKMSLANVQGKLNRSEMRNIMAGAEGVMQCAWKNVSGAVTLGNCTGTQYQCQTFANSWCASHSSHCASVTCTYAPLQPLKEAEKVSAAV